MSLGDRRILIVTGKGGVGKTTVATALGVAAARRGLRTVIAETSGARRVAPIFGRQSRGYELVELERNLHTLSITPLEAMEDYIVQQVKVRKIYELVFRNRVMGPFIDAVPGLHDAVQLGKIFDLAREKRFGRQAWDLIVVDAPATGHGLSMLASARTMMDLTRAGPLYEGVKLVHDVVDDPKVSGIVLVSLPEEMPVNETCELYDKLGEARDRVQLVALNQVAPRPLPEGLAWAATKAHLLDQGGPDIAEAVALTDTWRARVERQDAAREALAEHIRAPSTDLPQLLDSQPDLVAIAELGELLAAALRGRAAGATP